MRLPILSVALWIGLSGPAIQAASAGTITVPVPPGGLARVTLFEDLFDEEPSFTEAKFDDDNDGMVTITASLSKQRKATYAFIYRETGPDDDDYEVKEIRLQPGTTLPDIEPFFIPDLSKLDADPPLVTRFTSDFLDFGELSIGDTFNVSGGLVSALNGVTFLTPDDVDGPFDDPFGYTSTPFDGIVTVSGFTTVAPNPAPVPLPAALPLFTTALVAFFGLMRGWGRRNSRLPTIRAV